jgi:hypothetical protein
MPQAKTRERTTGEVNMNLQTSDAEAGAVAIAPRVSLDDIKYAVASQYEFTAAAAVAALGMPIAADTPLKVLSVCLMVMKNGFTVVGKSAPASPENFNLELGQKLAREDCIRQMWPLMGFALRDRLAAGA